MTNFTNWLSPSTMTKQSVDKSITLLFEATTGFHHPTLVEAHIHDKRENLLRQVLDVVIDGLN